MKARLIVFSIVILVVTSIIAQISIADGLGTRYLKKGMRGADVYKLQEGLQSIGYTLSIDGIFGPETDMIVREFQSSQKLVQDGIVGPDTLAVLRGLLSQSMIHMVQAGDTLYDIAKLYQVPLDKIFQVNGLSSSLIIPGQRILIPNIDAAAVDNQEYIVKNGENLSVIAQKFGLSADDLAEFNQINDPNKIRAGQLLTIPIAAVSTIAKIKPPDFIWPVIGRISSPYGWRNHPINNVRHFHGGIDIAVPKGTTVRAAAPGIVIKAGWMGEYGLGIVIDHSGGYTTWYGHNSQLLVKAGEQVTVNQPIAKVGSTGLSTGPHLDFRVKYHNETIDPVKMLP